MPADRPAGRATDAEDATHTAAELDRCEEIAADLERLLPQWDSVPLWGWIATKRAALAARPAPEGRDGR